MEKRDPGSKKLSLPRETLRRLTAQELECAVGGLKEVHPTTYKCEAGPVP